MLGRIGLVTLALAGCAAESGETTATTATTAPTTTTAPPIQDGRPYAVERSELVVEDTSRPTAAAPERGLAEQPTRTLPLLVLIPEGEGPFPVLVFSHGVTGFGTSYEPFLTDIASNGYAVIAPTFPLSSGPGGSIPDYVNQPDDVYFALDTMLEREPRLDGELVALGGHSLGAMTTVGAGYNSCCADPRVDAVFTIAAVEPPFPGGDYDDRPPTPLLLTHGDLDRTIVVGGSEDLYAAATGPVAFLRFPQGSHSGILTNAEGEVLRPAIVAWLDRWLLDDSTALDELPALVEASGVATLTVRGMEP